MLRAVVALVLLFPAALHAADTVVTTDRFELRSEPRINLHHFLLAWAAADAGAWPPYGAFIGERESWRVLLDDDEQRTWSAATGAYGATVNRSTIFDAGLISLRDWAAGVGSLGAVAPGAARRRRHAAKARRPRVDCDHAALLRQRRRRAIGDGDRAPGSRRGLRR